MPSLHPIQRGAVLPLVLEHAGVSEAGAGAELQSAAEGRVGTPISICGKVVEPSRLMPKLAGSELLAGGGVGSEARESGALLPGQGRRQDDGVVDRSHLAAGRKCLGEAEQRPDCAKRAGRGIVLNVVLDTAGDPCRSPHSRRSRSPGPPAPQHSGLAPRHRNPRPSAVAGLVI